MSVDIDLIVRSMGEGGTPVTVTGSLPHGSQHLVNTAPPFPVV